MIAKDYTNKEFGILKVLRRVGTRNNCALWLCECKCGKSKEVLSTNLKRMVSCGCVGLAAKKKGLRLVHGQSRRRQETELFKRWQKMIERCTNPNAKAYKSYGGRGITTCERWLLPGGEGFNNFSKWAILSNYRLGLSLERTDVNGNYDESNCTWIPKEDQYKNKRNTLYVTYEGQNVRLVDLVAQIGAVPYKTVWSRLEDGWDLKSALLTPSLRG